jgi:uncharacterized protein (DUF362 family)
VGCAGSGRGPDSGGERREFLKEAAALGLTVAGAVLVPGFGPLGLGGLARAAEGPSVSVAKSGEPGDLARRAVGALGGMGRFVSRGDVVLVKPNIGWDREPAQAADTNPEVVAAVVRMCLEAGAKSVRVMDRPCNDPRRCYKRSGIRDAVESIGDPAATIEFMDERKFVTVPIKRGKLLKEWTFHRDVLEADRRINVPIAKHHNAARLTMSLKNVMGVLGGNRGNIHHDLDAYIADLNTALRFDLVVLDAVRILTGNGPQGGRLTDVRKIDTVIAGSDPVAVDSFGATLFGITGRDVPHVLRAHEQGLGEIDLARIRVITA